MHKELSTEALASCLVCLNDYVLKQINFFYIYSTYISIEERKIEREGEKEEEKEEKDEWRKRWS